MQPTNHRPTADLLALFRAVQEFVAAAYPGHTSAVLTVELPGRPAAVLPIPPPTPPFTTNTSLPPDDLSALDAAVVEALAELPAGDTIPAEDVAERSGYPLNSRLREALARLARSGRIRNVRGQGYGPLS